MVNKAKIKTKTAKFIRSANFNKNFIVKIPKTKAAKRPAKFAQLKTAWFKLSSIFPKKTIGRLIKKLNFKAFVSLCFKSKRAETVKPERDNPGNTAAAWASPKITPSFFLISE